MVVESWVRAVAAGGPAAVATLTVAGQGSLGGFAALVVFVGAALYLAIVWRLQLRATLRAVVESAEPEQGALEPRGRTIARGLLPLVWVLPLVVVGIALDVAVVPLTVALGYGASEALSANRLGVAEQRQGGRLARDGRRYVWL